MEEGEEREEGEEVEMGTEEGEETVEEGEVKPFSSASVSMSASASASGHGDEEDEDGHGGESMTPPPRLQPRTATPPFPPVSRPLSPPPIDVDEVEEGEVTPPLPAHLSATLAVSHPQTQPPPPPPPQLHPPQLEEGEELEDFGPAPPPLTPAVANGGVALPPVEVAPVVVAVEEDEEGTPPPRMRKEVEVEVEVKKEEEVEKEAAEREVEEGEKEREREEGEVMSSPEKGAEKELQQEPVAVVKEVSPVRLFPSLHNLRVELTVFVT